MQRTIIHIDFDSFFASVEQQYDPKLRGLPIGITATNGRTCIIAASREAKRLGIRSPSRIYDAKKICPDIQFVSADFIKYWEISKKFIAIAKDYSPYVEVFSIDEVFIDVTHSIHLFGDTNNIVSIIKKRIQKEIGEHITVSIGISYNKMLAKMASGLQKPNGVVKIAKEDVEKVYRTAKLTDICGIGERVKLRLNKIGAYSFLQLRNFSMRLLIAEFGNAEAQFLKNVSFAIDDSPVIPYTQAPEVKSVGRNYCLPKNEYDQRIVLQNIYELCEEVGIKLRRLKKKARTVGLGLRGLSVFHQEKTSDLFLNTGQELFSMCLFLMRRNTWHYVRMISVWAASLEDDRKIPRSLFDKDDKKEKLVSTIDAINEKFGDHTIRNGFLLYADKLTTLPNGYMADKYERTKLAREQFSYTS